MIKQLQNRLSTGLDNARHSILSKVWEGKRALQGVQQTYGDIPAYAAQTALETVAPDIKARREDTDTRNDDLIAKLRHAYRQNKIGDEQGYQLGGRIEGLYNSQVPKVLQNKDYPGNRAAAVDRLADINEITDSPFPQNKVNLNMPLRQLIQVRHRGAGGDYTADQSSLLSAEEIKALSPEEKQAYLDDLKKGVSPSNSSGSIRLDTRVGYPEWAAGAMAHEFGHSYMDNMRPDKEQRLPMSPEEFIKMYDYYANQPTVAGENLRGLAQETRGDKELYDQNDPVTIANELYAQLHQLDPELLQREAPDLYGVSAWR